MEQETLTIRQKITEALKGGMLTAKDISGIVGIKEKEVFVHLEHVAKTNAVKGKTKFVVEPSKCLNCGFVFRKRERLKTPSKCPLCRSEEITETRFGIVEG